MICFQFHWTKKNLMELSPFYHLFSLSCFPVKRQFQCLAGHSFPLFWLSNFEANLTSVGSKHSSSYLSPLSLSSLLPFLSPSILTFQGKSWIFYSPFPHLLRNFLHWHPRFLFLNPPSSCFLSIIKTTL